MNKAVVAAFAIGLAMCSGCDFRSTSTPTAPLGAAPKGVDARLVWLGGELCVQVDLTTPPEGGEQHCGLNNVMDPLIGAWSSYYRQAGVLVVTVAARAPTQEVNVRVIGATRRHAEQADAATPVVNGVRAYVMLVSQPNTVGSLAVEVSATGEKGPTGSVRFGV